MTQVNINDPNGPEVVESTPAHTHGTPAAADTGHTVASGINLITTIVILVVAVVLVYFLFQLILPLVGR
jgi:hypothetical protein